MEHLRASLKGSEWGPKGKMSEISHKLKTYAKRCFLGEMKFLGVPSIGLEKRLESPFNDPLITAEIVGRHVNDGCPCKVVPAPTKN